MPKLIVHLTIDGVIEMEEEGQGIKLPLTEELGKRLKELRLAKRLSMRQLSQLSGVSPGEISKIEMEKCVPGIRIIAKLEKALQEDVAKTQANIEAEAWRVLYSIFGERMQQDELDLMDGVLQGVVTEIQDDKEREAGKDAK